VPFINKGLSSTGTKCKSTVNIRIDCGKLTVNIRIDCGKLTVDIIIDCGKLTVYIKMEQDFKSFQPKTQKYEKQHNGSSI
jgi:hypothetical protein